LRSNYASTEDNAIEILKFAMSLLFAFFTMIFIICFGAILLFTLYKFKCFMGIDIFPEHHLSDIIEIVKS